MPKRKASRDETILAMDDNGCLLLELRKILVVQPLGFFLSNISKVTQAMIKQSK
jgi:hypothetical protein